MFLNFADVKGGVHEAYSTPFVEWFKRIKYIAFNS